MGLFLGFFIMGLVLCLTLYSFYHCISVWRSDLPEWKKALWIVALIFLVPVGLILWLAFGKGGANLERGSSGKTGAGKKSGNSGGNVPETLMEIPGEDWICHACGSANTKAYCRQCGAAGPHFAGLESARTLLGRGGVKAVLMWAMLSLVLNYGIGLLGPFGWTGAILLGVLYGLCVDLILNAAHDRSRSAKIALQGMRWGFVAVVVVTAILMMTVSVFIAVIPMVAAPLAVIPIFLWFSIIQGRRALGTLRGNAITVALVIIALTYAYMRLHP